MEACTSDPRSSTTSPVLPGRLGLARQNVSVDIGTVATMVGSLVEVPVLVSLTYVALWAWRRRFTRPLIASLPSPAAAAGHVTDQNS
ncbi:MAG TPA: hypothetical protein VND96_07705 [Candidatus Micrarchaeaceae archaeon]|nr:hypothetical protein [Candidatus Micrarchaeaceae archaeon]